MNKTHTVLIIEDEEPMRHVLADTLGQEGLRVLEASDGKKGLSSALLNHPDLILLDIIMPQMSGMTVLKELRKDSWGQDVPVLILTNLNDIPSVINALEFDIADQEMIKNENVTPDMARKCIKRYLDMRLEHSVVDFLIKTNSKLEDIVQKIKKHLR